MFGKLWRRQTEAVQRKGCAFDVELMRSGSCTKLLVKYFVDRLNKAGIDDAYLGTVGFEKNQQEVLNELLNDLVGSARARTLVWLSEANESYRCASCAASGGLRQTFRIEFIGFVKGERTTLRFLALFLECARYL